jgi:hypothetical protein
VTPAEENPADIEQVIWLAYKEGYFGPTAYAFSTPLEMARADTENLIHLAAGGHTGERHISRSERARLVAALEDLFGYKYHFDVRPGRFVTMKPLQNVFWRPWALGSFDE